MHSVLTQFQKNITYARHVGALTAVVQSVTFKATVDVSDMLRSELVLSVSALDHFIHEICRVGMIEIASKRRPPTPQYLKFPIPVHATELALSGASPTVWMGDAVRERHSWQSFQDPDKIADAIRLFCPKKLWDEVALKVGNSARDVKTNLRVIIDRRNKIAHEADMDPSNPGTRWPIDDVMVGHAVGFIEAIGNAIFKVVL